MGELSFEHKTSILSDGSKCAVGKFAGSVDTSTNSILEDELAGFLNQKINQLVLDLSGLTYISSSGLGILLRYAQKYRNAGGDIKITQVPANIWTIFRTVGLDSVFEILGSDQQALRSFQEQVSYRPITKDSYPTRFKCPSCSGSLEIDKPGKFRCPHCTSYFAAEEDGTVKTFISRRPKIIETRIMDDTNNDVWIKKLVRSQAQWLNFNNEEIDKIEQAVDKTYRLCIDQTDKTNNRLVIKAGKKELIIGFISLNGAFIDKDSLKDHPGWQSIRQLVDRVEVIPAVPNGQIIKLVKVVRN